MTEIHLAYLASCGTLRRVCFNIFGDIFMIKVFKYPHSSSLNKTPYLTFHLTFSYSVPEIFLTFRLDIFCAQICKHSIWDNLLTFILHRHKEKPTKLSYRMKVVKPARHTDQASSADNDTCHAKTRPNNVELEKVQIHVQIHGPTIILFNMTPCDRVSVLVLSCKIN